MKAGVRSERGECSVCFDQVAINVDGTLRRHGRNLEPGGGWWCPGSLKSPNGAHVHVCRCGARWDEDAAS